MSIRLDAELAARGLARSRTHAARLIAAGRVRVDGEICTKPSTKIGDAQSLDVAADGYVSRGAHKLIAALDGFGVDVAGRSALDMGASTGGFTQVLRERGADPVVAVDVGHDQLAPEVAADAGVVSVEGFNVRHMTRDSLAHASGVAERPQIVTGDLSFISLAYVLGPVAEVCADGADVVLLVKPQFEVGRTGVRGGIVVDPRLRAGAALAVLSQAAERGLACRGVLPSPIEGSHGNREMLVHLVPGAGEPAEAWAETVARAVGADPTEWIR